MKKINSIPYITAIKMLITIVILFIVNGYLTGCDREAPVIKGIDSVIEVDCGTSLNLEDYLKKNVKITDETDKGTVQYKLSELEYTIECNEDNYNTETGDFNTEKFGEYDVKLSVKDENHNITEITFTVKLNPLHINSDMKDSVEMDCGTIFNVRDYFKEKLKIENFSENAEYKLDDFDYTIDCDETVYNAASGKLNTEKFGEYKATLTINSKSFEDNKVSFTIKLNPLSIKKGYYVYESDSASSGYEYLGFCEYKNTSEENLKVKSIEFHFLDKDGVTIGSSDMPEYSKEYVASGENGYALDEITSYSSPVSSSKEIASVKVNIDFVKSVDEDNTSLKVGDMEITNNYDSNESGFAGTTIITNPYDKKVEYYTLLAGMYDKKGELIGVMNSMNGVDGIDIKSKSRAAASWLPASRTIPDKVKSLKGSARVTSFEEK